MARYIELDALVAVIERLKKAEGWCQVGKDTADVYYARGFRFACERIKDALDTLEVKEVDLDKSLTGFMSRYAYENDDEYPSAIDIAKNFFELGIKAQKRE